MRRFSIGLIGFGLVLAGCAPDDPNVRPPKRDNFAQSRSERNQAMGLDYLQFAIYRLAEIKQVVEAAAVPPTSKLKAIDDNLCGQLVVDRTSGDRREQRFETIACTIQNIDARGVSLKADGVDVVASSFGPDGEIDRLELKSVLPYQVSGRISDSKVSPRERGGSSATLKERRELSLDRVPISNNGDGRVYRFSYGIELTWSQEIRGKNFTAFEDGSAGTLVMTGSLVLNQKNVETILLSSLRMDAFAPRTIKVRAKYTKGRTPDNQTFHKISLELKPGKGADDEATPLMFDKSACGLPVGDLVVSSYKGANSDDRLTYKDEKTVALSALGILVKATDQMRPWPDCSPDPSNENRFQPKAGEVRNRAPYHELLFK